MNRFYIADLSGIVENKSGIKGNLPLAAKRIEER